MKSVFAILIALSGSLYATLTERSHKFDMPDDTQKVEVREFKRADKRVLQQILRFTPNGEKVSQFAQLYIDGELTAVMEDSNFDGKPDGLTLFELSSNKMEYFYFEDDLKILPASSEEMAKLQNTANEVESFLATALDGEEVSSFDVILLKIKIWLRKWDITMLLTLGLLMTASFTLGKRSC